jgi:hypothetical protein
MDLQILRIESTEASNHVPTIQNTIDIADFTGTGSLWKTKPDPAIEWVNLAKTNVHGTSASFASSVKL